MSIDLKLTIKRCLFIGIRLTLIGVVGLMFSACQTTSQKNKIEFESYLNQFIGQDVHQLKENFNLDAFQIKLNPDPIFTSQRALFSFDRKISIPIPDGNVVKDSRGFMIPVHLASSANNYNTVQSCNLIFILNNNIVQSIVIKGKAC